MISEDLPRLAAGPLEEDLKYARGVEQPRVREVAAKKGCEDPAMRIRRAVEPSATAYAHRSVQGRAPMGPPCVGILYQWCEGRCWGKRHARTGNRVSRSCDTSESVDVDPAVMRSSCSACHRLAADVSTLWCALCFVFLLPGIPAQSRPD